MREFLILNQCLVGFINIIVKLIEIYVSTFVALFKNKINVLLRNLIVRQMRT